MPVRRFEQSEPDDMALRQRTGLAVPPGMPISERQQMAMIREIMSKEAAASTETKLSGKLFRFVLHTLQSRYQFVVRRLASLHVENVGPVATILCTLCSGKNRIIMFPYIITSTKKGYVFHLRLFVYLLTGLHKTTQPMLREISGKAAHGLRKKRLDFGGCAAHIKLGIGLWLWLGYTLIFHRQAHHDCFTARLWPSHTAQHWVCFTGRLFNSK